MAKRTDANQGEIVEALRKAGCSVTTTHTLGRGFPDLTVGYAGETFLLEVKASPREQLTPDEADWHTAWRGHVAIVTSPSEALAVVGIYAAPVARGARNFAQTRK